LYLAGKDHSMKIVSLAFATFLMAFQVSCSSSPKRWDYQYIPGKTASLMDGKAVPPAGLPKPVTAALEAGNRIAGKPYRYGGGHKQFEDTAYDCSGTVSYVLHAIGGLKSPTTSTALRNYGKKGLGKWITIYASKGHSFIVVAGLRLDTGYNGEGKGPKWTKQSRSIKGFHTRYLPGF
jgi:hypothetical protein